MVSFQGTILTGAGGYSLMTPPRSSSTGAGAGVQTCGQEKEAPDAGFRGIQHQNEGIKLSQ